MWKWIKSFFKNRVEDVKREVNRVSGRIKIKRRVIKPKNPRKETSSDLNFDD
jgi:hypothetical protein